ncbi:hypothetical protein [Oryzomonas rubra]|uniref:Uncharacterized protein n=1 Tax=Oryzomonas rubra TaxID=2509454 RepID=A0A5A9X4L0_9BACT|nr:hypothetical protein [Oryzomonas rubra]KAA0888082.1 hypothetical protein ET418_16920 [Oryzomonas rubra]
MARITSQPPPLSADTGIFQFLPTSNPELQFLINVGPLRPTGSFLQRDCYFSIFPVILPTHDKQTINYGQCEAKMASNKNRDDFTPDTINKLRLRVSNRCSNPSCRVTTSGPTADPQKVNSIGVAAHICAAAPGGPRYKASMTPAQRSHILNGIWLCASCSTDIDRDPNRFDEDTLYRWKNEAERLAREELGKKLPDKKDAIDTVAAALTGLPTTFIPNAIENVCVASTQALEKLDPRFMITASYQDKCTNFLIQARENVQGKLQIEKEFGQEFTNKFNELIAHGKTLEIDSSAIKMTGSKLFEELHTDKKGVFQIKSSFRKPAIHKFWLVNKNNEIFFLDDLVGEIIVGRDSFSFKGTAFNDILEFSFTQPHTKNPLKEFTFSMVVDFNCWNGKSVNSMQYFDKIYNFFDLFVEQKWQLFTKFEIEGKEIYSNKSPNFSDTDDLHNLYISLRYVFLLKEVLKYLNIDLKFNSNFEYIPELHALLSDIYRIASGKNVLSADEIAVQSCAITADKQLHNINTLYNATEAASITIKQRAHTEVEIFGQKVILPAISYIYTKVKPKFVDDISTIKPNQDCHIEWVPELDCQCIIDIVK